MDDGRPGLGRLAFGLAFAAIGVAWLLREAGAGIDAGWLVVIALVAFGTAGLSSALSRLL